MRAADPLRVGSLGPVGFGLDMDDCFPKAVQRASLSEGLLLPSDPTTWVYRAGQTAKISLGIPYLWEYQMHQSFPQRLDV